MNYLSLFTGAGGGDLAMQHLLGMECKGYVEWEPYCQEVIKARIKDGYLDDAPIFSDIRKFNSKGYAAAYQGMVDVVTGGPPCQPFAASGKRLQENDDRDMFPATVKTIRMVEPGAAFLENSPRLALSEYFWDFIIPELAGWVFDSGGGFINANVFNASSIGAGIERNRLFIAAVTNRFYGQAWLGDIKNGSKTIFIKETRKRIKLWLQAPSRSIRVGNGFPHYMDRVKAIGNAQVPIVAATAFRMLMDKTVREKGEG